MQKQLETKTIFVTHDQIEAMTIGDIIVVMNEGWIEQVGTPQKIYEHPATRFVAGFIGSPQMNVLASQINIDGDKIVFESITGSIEGSKALLSTASTGQSKLCVRSEDVSPQHDFGIGDTAFISFDTSRSHLFGLE